MINRINRLLLVFLLLGICFSSRSQTKENEKPKITTRILFVYDASQSMLGTWQSDRKITIASRLLCELLDSLKAVPDLEMGLRVYGHQKNFPPQDCDDTKLEIPLGPDNVEKIQLKLKTLNPKGTTPIAASLEAAGNDFPVRDNCRNIIVLITDGLEECDGDPCAVSLALQKKGIVLKPFIIGIGKNFAEAFECVGTYYDAANEKDFSTALKVVISQALNSTTAQVNLLDINGKPTETNVNMTFYDNFSGLMKYNYVHTLNNYGLPDTLSLDPLLTYNMVVHSIPPVTFDTIKLEPGKHTTIAVPAPQGMLELKVSGTYPYSKNLLCLVRQKGSSMTLNVQTFSEKVKYIIGTYDLEILTLPRLEIKDVEISQSKTTTVQIPLPGTAVIQLPSRGYGSLYVEEDNKLRLIYNMNEQGAQETLYLLPGKYKVVFRSMFVTRSFYTLEKTFKVESGMTIRVNMY